MNTKQRVHRLVVTAAFAAIIAAAIVACADSRPKVTVGLITKQEVNPFWITVREVAEDTADDEGVRLLTATGTRDTDNTSQVAALEEMTEQGAAGILIAPANSRAIVPAIAKARAAGLIVIAIDTPTEPRSAVDALYATDNRRAGELIGRYAAAKAKQLGLKPQIALLNLAPGVTSGEQRREGFLTGFGLVEGDAALVGEVDTEGDRKKGRAAMAHLLEQHSDINVVYTVNEPAALGAIAALKDAGKDLDTVVIVSIDGGCRAIKNALRPGDLDATAQQYPENMAREGVKAIASAARGGPRPSGYLDTGVELITGDPAPGVESRSVAFGVRNCWGG